MSNMLDLGLIIITPGALNALEKNNVMGEEFLNRHSSCDWGVVDKAEAEANDYAVIKGDRRIMSAYLLPDNSKIWVLTEWDHSTTTILLPEEY